MTDFVTISLTPIFKAWSEVCELNNPESIVWCVLAFEKGSRSLAPQGSKLWPFKGANTSVFRFSWGGYIQSIFTWHVANTISSLTAGLLINRRPPPALSLDTTPS